MDYNSLRDRERVYSEAINRWGVDSQFDVTIEECSELIKELAKRHRIHNGTSEEKIIEEIADVIVMCESLSMFFGKEKVFQQVAMKTERLHNWLTDNKKVW